MSDITLFVQHPDDYVLRLGKDNALIAEKKGVWTWIKANILFRGEYKLDKIVHVVDTRLSDFMPVFITNLNTKIVRYNMVRVPSECISQIDMDIYLKAIAKKPRISQPEQSISEQIDAEAKERRKRVLEAKKLQEQKAEPPELAFLKKAVWKHLEANEEMNTPLPTVILEELRAEFPKTTFRPRVVARQVFDEYIYIAASRGCRVAASANRPQDLNAPLIVKKTLPLLRLAVGVDFKGYSTPNLETALTNAVNKCLKKTD